MVLLTQKKVRLWLPFQVAAEYKRNRESKISDALKQMRESKVNLKFPAFCKDYDEYEGLQKYKRGFGQKHSEIIQKVLQDVKEEQLKVDIIIKQLFAHAENISVSDAFLQAAQIRDNRGNPPGKGSSLAKSGASLTEVVTIFTDTGAEVSAPSKVLTLNAFTWPVSFRHPNQALTWLQCSCTYQNRCTVQS